MKNITKGRAINGKHRYLPLVAGLYFNYIFQGMAAIIISQNMSALAKQWQASTAQVTLVISAIGLGRIISLYFSGYFSDRFGRKKTVMIAIFSYFIFFSGMLLSTNYQTAMVIALFGGFSNAFLDTSTYPTLVESYPSEKDNSSLSVLNKAFISLGQFLLPLMTRVIITEELYYGWPFVLCIVCLFLNVIFLWFQAFPPLSTIDLSKQKDEETLVEAQQLCTSKASFKIDGVALMAFSFVSVSMFNIFILWIPTFAEQTGIANQQDSLTFVSIYSIGSFVSVFLTSAIVKKGVNIAALMVFCTGITALALIYMNLYPSFIVVVIAALCVGVFAAGGIWQLGLALILEFFPQKKGRITSLYSLATSVSVMITPYLTGVMAEKDIQLVFWYDAVLTLIGLGATIVIAVRYKAMNKEGQVLQIKVSE
ncbi:MFS transporter [Enterococcus sp. LJL128]|uniref:MFS transporter n=1 Tax=Enterococcus sp. LJL51 TaxID=3416656 RepID=UPI003CEFD201